MYKNVLHFPPAPLCHTGIDTDTGTLQAPAYPAISVGT